MHNLSNVVEININMRCIEINIINPNNEITIGININVRCIEIQGWR